MWNVNAQVPRRRHSWNLPKPLLLRTARSCRTKSAVLYVRCHQTSGPRQPHLVEWSLRSFGKGKRYPKSSVLPNEHGQNLRTTRKCHSRQNIHTATYWMGRIDMLCWRECVTRVVWNSVASRNSSSWTHVHRTPRCPPPPTNQNKYRQCILSSSDTSEAWCLVSGLYTMHVRSPTLRAALFI